MAKGFSEQSGGGIHIESAPGKGTTVHLYFPSTVSAPLPPSRNEERLLRPSLIGKNLRLLLVEDDPMVRDVVTAQMEDAGLLVAACASGSEALERLDRGEAVDVLVSDLSMPVMDGLTLIREAQRRRPNLPSILLTGFSTNVAEISINGAFEGPFLLLRKPICGEAIAGQVVSLREAAVAKRTASDSTTG